ncbi:MAG TPA: transglycosylase domain-containing protein [Candidatus Dormibacteraeota bacterium]|nr:transglycosylase domain-containing protein [Candidatus Dormibacteraeota bacterium]
MSSLPRVLRRAALGLLLLVVVLGPSATTLWISTPSGTDAQARVADLTHHYGVELLGPGDVPPMLAKAVVATEDERFYTHHGIDSLGLARALLYDASNRCPCQGGSTITEQLVKDVYLDGSDRGYNKLVDTVMALKVERVLTKQQIMADYLSEITTGLNRYGVKSAACAYFHAPLQNLTLGQYALLAGVTQAPSLYDPTVDPEAAEQRRSQVLASMISEGFITPAQALAANAEPVLATGGGGC